MLGTVPVEKTVISVEPVGAHLRVRPYASRSIVLSGNVLHVANGPGAHIGAPLQAADTVVSIFADIAAHFCRLEPWHVYPKMKK